MIRLMVEENTLMLMVLLMKEIGMKINKTVMVLKLGLIMPVMRVIIRWVRSMGKENSNGQMALNSRVSLLRMTLKDMASIHGLMIENMKVNGRLTRWMVRVHSIGLIRESMKESIRMVKSMDKVPLSGLMVKLMKVAGNMVNNMVKVFIHLKRVRREKDYGAMVRELNG